MKDGRPGGQPKKIYFGLDFAGRNAQYPGVEKEAGHAAWKLAAGLGGLEHGRRPESRFAH